ncbi:MAG: glycine--tRNA ligase [Candidatus Omnitrophota bacterium]
MTETNTLDSLEKIVSLCKRRGFIFQSSEIYGGAGSVWDYGPLGVELKRNVKQLWWQSYVYGRSDIEGIDAGILMHPSTWEASGHIHNFTDTLVDCKDCKKRFRVDHMKSDNCPECGGQVTEPRRFNLMFKVPIGAVEDSNNVSYLRPETAQGIFVNFQNVVMSMRKKIPFGIAQIGKAFRNEIATGNFTFRSREFEQMEIEFFVEPGTDEEWHRKWVEERYEWYLKYGIRKEKLRLREHSAGELAHYAKACTDVEYDFPMGWSELEGIANRKDFDLTQHVRVSGKDLSYFDDEKKSRYVPYVIEPSGGVDRTVLAFLVDAYREEKVKDEKRVVLALHKALAPVKVAVLPLSKKNREIVTLAKEIANGLRKCWKIWYDDTASIGRLYRRQDEIGTPFCVTVDFDSLHDNKVTVRGRDTMTQERIPVAELKSYLSGLLE